jgi:hypothetical protein
MLLDQDEHNRLDCVPDQSVTVECRRNRRCRPNMELSERLKSLSGLDKPALCKLWSELFKERVPVGVRRELLVRILAYRLQEQAFGGLSPRTHRRLRQIAAHIESGKANPTAEPQRIKAGTRLFREWQGKRHIVTANQTGYEYQGARYGSLSEIARDITGTRWSGPLFFGLKANNSKRNGAQNGR